MLCKYNKNLPNLFMYMFSYLPFVYILSSKCLQSIFHMDLYIYIYEYKIISRYVEYLYIMYVINTIIIDKQNYHSIVHDTILSKKHILLIWWYYNYLSKLITKCLQIFKY